MYSLKQNMLEDYVSFDLITLFSVEKPYLGSLATIFVDHQKKNFLKPFFIFLYLTKIMLTTWLIFHQVERRFHGQESNQQSL